MEKEPDAPAPPPATWDASAKKSQVSNGVMAMIDMLAADLGEKIEEEGRLTQLAKEDASVRERKAEAAREAETERDR